MTDRKFSFTFLFFIFSFFIFHISKESLGFFSLLHEDHGANRLFKSKLTRYGQEIVFHRMKWRNFRFSSITCQSSALDIGNLWDVLLNLLFFLSFFSEKYLDFDMKYFWAWTDFQSYLDFMLAVWFVGAVITYFMLPYTFFMEAVGFIAVFTEAMLGKLSCILHFMLTTTHVQYNSWVFSFHFETRCPTILAKFQ